MGKFTDTQYKNTMDTLFEGVKTVINNPYYLFTDQKGLKVNYYAINRERSTLDSDSKMHNATTGKVSAFRYNKIKDFYLFGFEKVTLNIEVGDVGTEADPIEGDCIILPKTIEPADGDCFVVTSFKEPLLFRVNKVDIDTLDTGSNIYKISYKIFDNTDQTLEEIEAQVIDTYEFIVKNVGTQFKCLIKSADYALIGSLETLLDEVIGYYKRMFFKDSVQTFVYNHNGENFYDPYLIEFCIRNKVFSYGSEYTYLTQQVYLPTTFAIDYRKSLFYSIEERDTQNVSTRIYSGMTRIEDLTSLFYYKGTDYYLVDYCQQNVLPSSRVQIFDMDLIDRIKNNSPYDDYDKKAIYNLLIHYMNSNDDYLKSNTLACVKSFNIEDNRDCFYGLMFAIFVIERFIENSLS